MWLLEIPEIIQQMIAKLFLLMLITIEIYYLNQEEEMKRENDKEKAETSKQRKLETQKKKQEGS